LYDLEEDSASQAKLVSPLAKWLSGRMRAAVWLIGLLALMALPAGCSTNEVGRSDLPIESDFSECDGWSTDEDEHISMGCENGQYRVLIKDASTKVSDIIPRRSKDAVDSVAVQADVVFQTAPGVPGKRLGPIAGVGCWVSGVNDPARGYYFALAPGQGGAILRVNETDKSLEKQFFLRDIADTEPSAVKEVGEVNHLRGECRPSGSDGVDLTMWVNGEQVAEANDPSGFLGYEAFGFATYSSERGSDFRFDNFVAEELHEQS
jgi:hypothetical protein